MNKLYNIKSRQNEEIEEFPPDAEVCPQCNHILGDDEDACLCTSEEDYNLAIDSLIAFLGGCDVDISEEEN